MTTLKIGGDGMRKPTVFEKVIGVVENAIEDAESGDPSALRGILISFISTAPLRAVIELGKSSIEIYKKDISHGDRN